MQIRSTSDKAELILKALITFAPDSFVEIVTTPITMPPWEQLIAALQRSSMSRSMKIACLAQAALESGWGESLVAKTCLNFWGMKYRSELDGIATLKEVPVTSEVSGKAVFAQFSDVDSAVKGWRVFLTRPYYAGWEKYTNDTEGFLRHIGKNWCPVKGYAEKVIALIPKAQELLNL